MWAKLSLAPAPFRDQASCWHGSGIYEDCNNGLKMRNAMIKYQVDDILSTALLAQEYCIFNRLIKTLFLRVAAANGGIFIRMRE